MAKRKQDDTQELPPMTIEAVQIVTEPDSTQMYIINDDTGELRQVTARLGYAPVSLPFGFRLAHEEEVPGK